MRGSQVISVWRASRRDSSTHDEHKWEVPWRDTMVELCIMRFLDAQDDITTTRFVAKWAFACKVLRRLLRSVVARHWVLDLERDI